jgi:hypothetical protein
MHWCLQGDDDIDGIGIDNVLDENGSCQFYEILNGSWKWKMKQFLIAEWERVLMETKKEEVNRIWIHVCIFKLLDFYFTILVVIVMSQ